MAELARIKPAAAPACPTCGQRLDGLDLDALSGGSEIRCPACGHAMRIPQAVLDRLREQREAERAAEGGDRSFLARLRAFFSRLLK